MDACRSRANANYRLPRASLGRIEGGDGVVDGGDGADVRPQSSVPHPLDDLAQLRYRRDKRVPFLERIEAMVRLSDCDVQTAINEAMAGLKYNAAARLLFARRLT
jgi:hypothetical protein